LIVRWKMVWFRFEPPRVVSWASKPVSLGPKHAR
jgi:hypothetical protein